MRWDNVQCRYRPHTHASIRRATARVEDLARSTTNLIVRHFLLPRCVTSRWNSFPEVPKPQYTFPRPSEQAPPHSYQTPQQYTGPPIFHDPVQPPAPKQKPAQGSPRVFHRSEYTGKKKAVCVRVLGILAPTLAPNLTLINASVQIGINYMGTARELKGCVNDAKSVCKFLISRSYLSVLQNCNLPDPPDRKLEF